MTRKRARAKFYSALRSIASNYEWRIVGGAIRGQFKDARDQKDKPYYPFFCPITATHSGNSRFERVRLSQYHLAGEKLGLHPHDTALIAHSADFQNHPTGNKQVRETLLRCVGLA